MKYDGVRITGLLILLTGIALFIILYMNSSWVWLDEAFTVPPGQASAYCGSFYDGTTLTISINVVSGGSRDINFWVMDETEWEHFKQGESFNYYTVPSWVRITTGSLTWTPPANQEICFVYDNTFSLITTKTVYTKIIVNWDLMRFIAFLIVVLAVFIGIWLIVAGSAIKSKVQIKIKT